jgi:hypothetical protein
MRDPIFVSGLRKSGTSLVRNLLDGHPEIFMYPPDEVPFFRYSHHESLVQDKLAEIDDQPELLEMLAGIDFLTRMNDPDAKDYREQVDVETFQHDVADATPESHRDIYRADRSYIDVPNRMANFRLQRGT